MCCAISFVSFKALLTLSRNATQRKPSRFAENVAGCSQVSTASDLLRQVSARLKPKSDIYVFYCVICIQAFKLLIFTRLAHRGLSVLMEMRLPAPKNINIGYELQGSAKQ